MTAVLTVLPGASGQRYESHLAALQSHGIRVIREESPFVAIAQVAAYQPDLVIIGRSTLAMDGLEIVALLCRRPGRIPAIVVLPGPDETLDSIVCTQEGDSGRVSIDHCPSNRVWGRIAEICGLRPKVIPARQHAAADEWMDHAERVSRRGELRSAAPAKGLANWAKLRLRQDRPLRQETGGPLDGEAADRGKPAGG